MVADGRWRSTKHRFVTERMYTAHPPTHPSTAVFSPLRLRRRDGRLDPARYAPTQEARSKACLGRRVEGSACVGGSPDRRRRRRWVVRTRRGPTAANRGPPWPGGARRAHVGRSIRPTRRPVAGFGAVPGLRVRSLAPPRAGAGERRPRGGGVKRLPGCGQTGNRSGGARSPAHHPDDGRRRRSFRLPARTNPASADPHAAGDAGY